jgi:precorrin isomerase
LLCVAVEDQEELPCIHRIMLRGTCGGSRMTAAAANEAAENADAMVDVIKYPG